MTLAIDGGSPIRETLLPYARQSVGPEDEEALLAALRSGWLTTGPAVAEFEEAFAAQVGAKHAVALSSGTAALHAAMSAAGVTEGSEVVTTPLSFVATSNAVLYMGGKPVFADVEGDTLLLDVERVALSITERTRAIACVDYAGQPCDLAALRVLAREHGLLLIEDAAHSLGARYEGQPVGSQADLTCFSFHPVKHVAAAEGGMVTTEDSDLAEHVRRFRHHGISADFRQRAREVTWEYEIPGLGFNYRLSDLHSALGRSQLRRLGSSVERRAAIAARYGNAFAEVPAVECLGLRAGRTCSWHLYPLRLDLSRLRVGRREVFEALRAENIGVNVHYIPIPTLELYRNLGYSLVDCPVAEAEYTRLLSIPLFPAMLDEDVEDVIAAVRKVISAYAA